MSRHRLPWLLLGVLILAQIGYPLTADTTRARLTVTTVLIGYLLSVTHAWLTRGPRTAAALVAVATGGGLAVEAVGVATGVPFGVYDYSGQLGPKLAGVPLIIPLAWTWMAWPAWLAAVRLTRSGAERSGAAGTTNPPDAAGMAAARILLAGVGLAAWDLFLDPQMVAEGYWTWVDPAPALPGVPGIPVGNYLGWLLVGLGMMSLLRLTAGPVAVSPGKSAPGRSDTGRGSPGRGGAAADRADRPMYALYLWTYFSSILAHAVFLDLPASAAWGATAMSVVAVPLLISLVRGGRAGTGPA